MSNPNLRRLITASASSNLADGMFQIALPLVALGITRDPGAFAMVALIGRLPWLLFALPAGALADRLDRRHTMVLVNVIRATVIGALAAVVSLDLEALWLLYLLAFVLGVGETLFDTAAQSMMPSIVPVEDLSRANGRLYAVEITTNQFVGPPLGGVIAGFTLVGALTGSAVAYALAALALTFMVGSFRPVRTGPPRSMRSDIAEGIAYLARHRLLRTLAICVGISNMAGTAMFAVFPLYALDPGPMGLSPTGFGLLLTTTAVGSVLGAFVVPRFERLAGRRLALLVSASMFALFTVGPAVTSNVWVIAPLFVISAVGTVVWNVITVSLRQRIVPDHLLGRVNSGYRLLAWGTMPLGAGLGGLIGSAFGVVAVFWVATVIGVLCVPLILIEITSARLAECDTPSSSPPSTPSPTRTP